MIFVAKKLQAIFVSKVIREIFSILVTEKWHTKDVMPSRR